MSFSPNAYIFIEDSDPASSGQYGKIGTKTYLRSKVILLRDRKVHLTAYSRGKIERYLSLESGHEPNYFSKLHRSLLRMCYCL